MVDEYPGLPECGLNFASAHKSAGVAHQQNQDLHRQFLEADSLASLPQRVGSQIEFEIGEPETA